MYVYAWTCVWDCVSVGTQETIQKDYYVWEYILQ